MSDLYARLLARCDARIQDIEELGEQGDGMVNVVRAVLELHKPEPYSALTPDGYQVCTGCDGDGYEWERPASPCSTIRVIADALGVTDQERIEEKSE